MRLFSVPNGSVDRNDRSSWLTCPFDLAFVVKAGEGSEIVTFVLNVCRTKYIESNVCRVLTAVVNICRTKVFTVER